MPNTENSRKVPQDKRRQNPKNRQRAKRQLKLYTVLFFCSFVVFVVCAGFSIRILLDERNSALTNRNLQSLMNTTLQDEGVADDAIVFDENLNIGSETMNSDFSELYQINSDLIGWVKAGKSIDLPVVQTTDNIKYLNTDYYGKSSSAGTVFLDAENVISPADDNLVLYGHNMKSGSMFGKLTEYRALSYLKQYPVLQFRTIYESAAESNCVPFAVFDASMEPGDSNYFHLRNFSFANETAKLAYIEQLKTASLFNIPVEVGANDQLVTLVTCSYADDDGRFIVAMRKLRSGETPQSMASLVSQAVAK